MPQKQIAESKEHKVKSIVETKKQSINSQEIKVLAPAFVVSSAVYAPSDSDTDSSDDESYDKSYEFTEKQFNKPPFKINTGKRGSLESVSEEIPNPETGPHKSKILQPLLNKLSQEGFANEGVDIKNARRGRLAASFGLNRPKSLSSGKNRIVTRELEGTLKRPIAAGSFGFFWNYPWERIKNIKAGIRSALVEYKEVRSFYKQLKKRDAKKARDFRRANENQSRNTMVPYREIRNRVKNHSNTTWLVERLRQKQPSADVYLSFIDGDTRKFCKDKEGIYSAYTRLYQEHGPVEVMSTGYEYFNEEKHELIQFASLLDRMVRAATATFIPAGVYYPEPNLCVRILKNKTTVAESFQELTSKGKEKQTQYVTPKESVILLEQVAQRPGYKSLFASESPLLTATPARALLNKKGTPFSFKAKSKRNVFHDWVWQDIINVTRNVSQSHVKSRDWAINLLNAFSCKKEVQIGDVKLTNGAAIRRIVISILSRLFASFDPVSIVQNTISGNDTAKKTEFIKVLQHYNERISKDKLPIAEREYKKNKEAQAMKVIDACHSRTQLKEFLAKCLVNCDPDIIESAAKASCLAIQSCFVEFFHFGNDKVAKKLDLSEGLKAEAKTTVRGEYKKVAPKKPVSSSDSEDDIPLAQLTRLKR